MATDDRTLLKKAFGRTRSCPAPETIAAMCDGSLSDKSTLAARKHIEQCTFCRTEAVLLESFLSDDPESSEEAEVDSIQDEVRRSLTPALRDDAGKRARGTLWPAAWGAPWRLYTVVGALAATLGITALVEVPKLQLARGPALTSAAVWRSSEVTNLLPAGSLSLAPRRFEWRPLAGASMYEVRLRTVDESEIWRARSSTGMLSIPPVIAGRFKPGRAFSWEVAAFDASGQNIGRSNLQRFSIGPNK